MLFKRTFLIALLALIPGTLRAQGVASQVLNAGTLPTLPIPLASYAQGQAMMAQAAQKAALLDINFTFLDKTYEKDTYATDPLGNKYKTGCYRFKATAGFQFKVDVPQYKLTSDGLTITQNISKLNADALTAKAQVLVCQEFGLGFGFRVSDLTVVYKARPMISFSQSNGACTVGWNQDTDDTRVSIGDVNILGVQNDIDKLAKDAVREAVNLALDGFFGSMLRNELLKISVGVCGSPKSRR